MSFRFYILLLISLVAVSCHKNSFESIEDYKEWVFSEESGCVQKSETSVMVYELTYLPNQLNQKASDEEDELDVRFQFKIYPQEKENVLKYGLSNQEEYKQRVEMLEFNMESLFYIVQDSLKPSFTHYENFRGIKNEILVHVHFTLNEKLSEDLTVVFKDQLYHDGSQHFTFENELINNPPSLIIGNH